MTGMLPNDLEMLADIPGADQYAQPEPAERQDTPPPPPAEVEVVLPEPPAPAPQAAPMQAQPQQQNGPSDWQQEVAQYARMQRELLERQPQPQPQAAPQWVDPAERPENQARLADLYQRLAYDEQAQREFNQLQAQMTNERVQYQTAQQIAAVQQQMQFMYAAPQVQQSAFAEVQGQYGQTLTRDNWDAVLRETFGDNPQAIAQALDPRYNPAAAQTRILLADAAANRAVRNGQQAAPQPRAVPPVSVQSAARNPAPSRANLDQWSDPAYMQSVMDRAYDDPYQFIRRNGGQ